MIPIIPGNRQVNPPLGRPPFNLQFVPGRIDPNSNGNEWLPYQAVAMNLDAEFSRFMDPTRSFYFEWSHYKNSNSNSSIRALLARTLYMRVLGDGPCTWSKILACADELGDSEGAENWIQAVYLIIDDLGLPQPSEAEKHEFMIFFERFKPHTLEQLVESWKLTIEGSPFERQFVVFNNSISRETAEEIYRGIDIRNFTLKDMRLIMMLLVSMDPDFWLDKSSLFRFLANEAIKEKEGAIHRLDKVFLNEFLLVCLLRGTGDEEEVWSGIAKDEPFVISAFMSVIFLRGDSLRTRDICRLIEIVSTPRDLNLIARIINKNHEKWDEFQLQEIMNVALLKDYLIFQLSEEVTNRCEERDIFKHFRELNIPEIQAMVNHFSEEIALEKGCYIPLLRRGQILARHLEVFAEGNREINDIYCQCFQEVNKNNIYIRCWSLNTENSYEKAISTAWMRRCGRLTNDAKCSEYMVRAISVRNNFMGPEIYKTGLGTTTIIREAVNGTEWHERNVDIVKSNFEGDEFFAWLSKVTLFNYALEIYEKLPSIPKWSAKFVTTLINTKVAIFRSEDWELLNEILMKESWTLVDVNSSRVVGEHLIRLLKVVDTHPTVLQNSKSEDLLDWVDTLLTCKGGKEEDWMTVQEYLQNFQSRLKTAPKKKIPRGKGKGKGGAKTFDPFLMKLQLLRDHIKKVVNSEEQVLQLIAQRRLETLKALAGKRNETVEFFKTDLLKIMKESEQLEAEQTEDLILKNFNETKKLALKTLLNGLEETGQLIQSLYKNTELQVENYLREESSKVKFDVVSKKLLQWQKGVMATIEEINENVQLRTKKCIQVYETEITKAVKQRDFDLRKREILNQQEASLGADPYLEIIRIQNQALEDLKSKRVEKILQATSEEEIEKVTRVFDRKVEEIKYQCNLKIGRLAKVKIADNSEELLKRKIKELESENSKVRKELVRFEDQVKQLHEAALSANIPDETTNKISKGDLVALLESIVRKERNAHKMIKMLQQEGNVLRKVEDLYQFLDYAGFQRVDENGGSHRTFRGPQNGTITIANHNTDSTLPEIESVIEAVYHEFKN